MVDSFNYAFENGDVSIVQALLRRKEYAVSNQATPILAAPSWDKNVARNKHQGNLR